jgi:hypothetical protein
VGIKPHARSKLLVTICCLLSGAFHNGAQNITGSIVGYVNDSSGATAPGAAVLVLNQGTGAYVEATVDKAVRTPCRICSLEPIAFVSRRMAFRP